MSGGHFDYDQYRIGHIAAEIEHEIFHNLSTEKDEFGFSKGNFYTDATIAEFKNALTILRQAEVYAQRIDWLLSGDDGEDTFHRRLKADLEKLK
jgi:hypothetical protein